MNLFEWLNDAFLSMTWLENLVNWFLITILGLEPDSTFNNEPLNLYYIKKDC
jgi:hypothetical protein